MGPTVTLYEITPEQGVRISKIRGLEDDIALSLSADGIRIIAPIPGKGTIGIEVPNKNPKIVSGQSVIGSKKFQESKYDLPIVLGKTITNEVFMFDLCKMPHTLAGLVLRILRICLYGSLSGFLHLFGRYARI